MGWIAEAGRRQFLFRFPQGALQRRFAAFHASAGKTNFAGLVLQRVGAHLEE